MGDEIDSLAEGRKVLAGLIQDVFGPGAKEMGAVIADQVRLYRWKRSVSILERAQKFAKARGVSPKQLPYNFLVPFIEKSSLSEDDDLLTTAWANLLVSAAGGADARHRLFTDILSELDVKEASLLRTLYEKARAVPFQTPPFMYSSLAQRDVLLRHLRFEIEDGRPLNELIFPPEESPAAGCIVSIEFSSSSQSAERQSDTDFLLTDEFGMFHLMRLELLRSLIEALDPEEDTKLDPGIFPVHVRFALLTPLGFQFVATCEGAKFEQ